MRALTGLILLALPGCIVIESGDPVRVPCCGAAEGAELTTVSVMDDVGLALSLTDQTGPLACALSEDDELELGRAGTQLFLRVQPGYFLGCEDGVHTLGGPECTPGEGVPVGCGRLRTWNTAGELVEESWAISGAVIVSEDGFDRCRFEVEAVLPGGQVVAGEFVTEELEWLGAEAVCDEG